MDKLCFSLICNTRDSIKRSYGKNLRNPTHGKKEFIGTTQFTSIEHLILLKLLLEFLIPGGEVYMYWNETPIYKHKTRFEFTRFTLEIYTKHKRKSLLSILDKVIVQLPSFLYRMYRGWYSTKEKDGYRMLLRKNTYTAESLIPFSTEPLEEDAFWSTIISIFYPKNHNEDILISQVEGIITDKWTVITTTQDHYTTIKKNIKLRVTSSNLDEVLGNKSVHLRNKGD